MHWPLHSVKADGRADRQKYTERVSESERVSECEEEEEEEKRGGRRAEMCNNTGG